ncbi:hypothetical protein DXN04_31785 [Chitinophaga silvisoli]|uniref:Uncharacterized protein n=1 Tax=Chitinophaga silvisoli TaxID=2291814 RepID=A0A3E1NSU7_9BACT|nr:hypothetical protein DXN04_31785 [Chitinophaga silvisoli]
MTVAFAQLIMVFTSMIASAALSPSLGKWLVHFIGYNSTFLLLGSFAIASIILWTSGYKFLQESSQPACCVVCGGKYKIHNFVILIPV